MLVPQDCPLSPRMFECLQLKAFGLTYQQIGLKLGIRPSTVRTHLGKAYVQLGVSGWPEAVTMAVTRGWTGFVPRTAAQPEHAKDPPLPASTRLYLEGLDRVLHHDPTGYEAMDLGIRAMAWQLGRELRRHRRGPGGLFGDLIRGAIEPRD